MDKIKEKMESDRERIRECIIKDCKWRVEALDVIMEELKKDPDIRHYEMLEKLPERPRISCKPKGRRRRFKAGRHSRIFSRPWDFYSED
ncbi:MAG: hypothetical protein Q4E54_00185 [Lachnospiraceae bacterium]|nr:hypothetical protein [Lachnospiraceae bacterium]